MLLSNLSSQFIFRFPTSFFYPEIHDRWTPVVKRLKLPYENLEDFMNSAVQSINFPSVDLPTFEQGQGQYKIQYRPGKELEPLFEKKLDITFKLSEGFITYWILFEQIEAFIKYYEVKKPFWDSMYISFLDHHGFELIAFTFKQIIPISLSQFEISYATTAAEFKTFTLSLHYNRFDIQNKLKIN